MATRGFGIRESVERCFKLGFGLVEVGAGHKYEAKAVETVLKLKRENPEKHFTVHALFPPMKSPERNNYAMNLSDENEHAKILETAAGMFEITKMLGSGVVGMHGGYAGEVAWVPDRGGFDTLKITKPINESVAERNMLSVLEKLAAMAEDRDIKLAIEVCPFDASKPLLSTPEIFKKVFSGIKSENLGMLLDVGHAHVSAAAKGFDPYEFAERFHDKIFEMHLHDVVDGRDHNAVGTGVVDFRKHFEPIGRDRLKRIPIVFEYTNLVDEAAALRGKKIIEGVLKSM
ncbi:MAG: sugar phosphate isomerase/epimerase [Candidatus Aenigmarchaeota archaeon]|nr:sugar phosphate isomerase/epimerase [Candidatus Aenigmarchaeota archaeon]